MSWAFSSGEEYGNSQRTTLHWGVKANPIPWPVLANAGIMPAFASAITPP
jgi:hypothetical protein